MPVKQRLSVAHMTMLKVVFWILVWYTLSISLTMYNKWIFTVYGLSFPLLVTSFHFLVKLVLARALMWQLGIPSLSLDCFGPVGRWTALTGFATAADVAISNTAFLFIMVTTYTVVKSSVPMWILAFSICFRLQKPRMSLALVILILSFSTALVALDPSAGEEPAADVPSVPEPSSVPSTVASTLRLLRRLGAIGDGAVAAYRETATAAVAPAPPSPSPPELQMKMSSELFGIGLVGLASLCGGFRWACSQMILTQHTQHAQHAQHSQHAQHTQDTQRVHAQCAPSDSREEASAPSPRAVPLSPTAADAPHSPTAADATPAAAPSKGVHPFALVYATALYGELLLLPAAAGIELRDARDFAAARPPSSWPLIVGITSLGGIVAFLLLVAELHIVSLSSGLTLSLAGIFKDFLTAAASVVLLGEVISPYKAAGLAMCTLGLAVYNKIKWDEMKEAEAERAARAATSESQHPSETLQQHEELGSPRASHARSDDRE